MPPAFACGLYPVLVFTMLAYYLNTSWGSLMGLCINNQYNVTNKIILNQEKVDVNSVVIYL
jgi:hypothetical protein